MPKRGRRWETHFGRWITRLGVSRVVRGLRQQHIPITRQAVYNYVSGARSPRLEIREAMMRIGRGAIQREDIDQHVLRMRSRPSLTVER